MRNKRTKFCIVDKDTVAACRTIINDHGFELNCRSEVIRNGEPQEKPGPDFVFGSDLWPDWQQVVRKAKKKLDGLQRQERHAPRRDRQRLTSPAL